MIWNAENIPDMTGKVVIVTGANSGIGYETARALAHKGAQVIMACRNMEKAGAAAGQIRDENPAASPEVMPLDLADLDSVRDFAGAFLAKYDRLDVLVNNAGVMALPERWETKDGFEMQFGTNHLGHFALTGRLLGLLVKTPDSRIVTVSSAAHLMGWVNFDNLNAEKRYQAWVAYGLSKIANLYFTYELQRRFEAAGIPAIAAAAHPGWTATNLQAHSTVSSFFNPILAQAPEDGALPTLYAATAPGVRGGDYFGPDGMFELQGPPKKVRSNKRSHDPAVAERLWDVSEQLTGVTYRALNGKQ